MYIPVFLYKGHRLRNRFMLYMDGRLNLNIFSPTYKLPSVRIVLLAVFVLRQSTSSSVLLNSTGLSDGILHFFLYTLWSNRLSTDVTLVQFDFFFLLLD